MIRFSLLGLALGIIGSLAWQRPSSVPMELAFRDSITGAAVIPSSISIEALDLASATICEVRSDSYGHATAYLPKGRYRVSAAVHGNTLSAETQVVREAPEMVFHFDPRTLPKEADPAVIRKVMKPDAFTVTGFAVDDVTGQPVPGLKVHGQTTTSEGAFLVYLPLSGNPTLTVSGGDYGTVTYSNFETWPNGDIQLRVRLKRGESQSINLRDERRRGADDPMEHVECDSCTADPTTPTLAPRGASGPAMPKSIRVGRNCGTATTCTTVEVYSVQTYTARVLSSEWYGCWGSVTGGMDSLRAGAVAVRSYGVYHAYNPRTSTYDICDTSSCQVFGSSTNTNSLNATNDTNRYVLTNASGVIVRSEYSAENNNSGCGDGFTGTGASGAPCISDPVCTSFAMFGHGRGLCQWGSARWATQKVLSSSQACTSAAPNTNQPRKDWIEILNHYYPSYNLLVGAEATLNSITANPSSIAPGASTALQYSISSTADVNNVWLVATLSLNGTGAAVANTANQVRVNLNTGQQEKQRTFATQTTLPPGPYTVNGSLYFDRDSSNTLNTGDFLMADGSYAGALTVSVPADPTSMQAINVTGRAGAVVQLRALLLEPDGTPIPGQTVTFTVNGVSAGSTTTSDHGLALVDYAISPSQAPSVLPIVASFASTGSYQASSDTATLTVTRRP